MVYYRVSLIWLVKIEYTGPWDQVVTQGAGNKEKYLFFKIIWTLIAESIKTKVKHPDAMNMGAK